MELEQIQKQIKGLLPQVYEGLDQIVCFLNLESNYDECEVNLQKLSEHLAPLLALEDLDINLSSTNVFSKDLHKCIVGLEGFERLKSLKIYLKQAKENKQFKKYSRILNILCSQQNQLQGISFIYQVNNEMHQSNQLGIWFIVSFIIKQTNQTNIRKRCNNFSVEAIQQSYEAILINKTVIKVYLDYRGQRYICSKICFEKKIFLNKRCIEVDINFGDI
ncbi:hypothetical protein ABPG72_003301 [Tetrahymena utriculariae]